MPVVLVEMWEGRTREQKKQIIEGITAVWVNMGVPPDQVHIILKDNPKDSWGVSGMMASEKYPDK
jgi:4-oxalocrotonate tautomerase